MKLLLTLLAVIFGLTALPLKAQSGLNGDPCFDLMMKLAAEEARLSSLEVEAESLRTKITNLSNHLIRLLADIKYFNPWDPEFHMIDAQIRETQFYINMLSDSLTGISIKISNTKINIANLKAEIARVCKDSNQKPGSKPKPEPPAPIRPFPKDPVLGKLPIMPFPVLPPIMPIQPIKIPIEIPIGIPIRIIP